MHNSLEAINDAENDYELRRATKLLVSQNQYNFYLIMRIYVSK